MCVFDSITVKILYKITSLVISTILYCQLMKGYPSYNYLIGEAMLW